MVEMYHIILVSTGSLLSFHSTSGAHHVGIPRFLSMVERVVFLIREYDGPYSKISQMSGALGVER